MLVRRPKIKFAIFTIALVYLVGTAGFVFDFSRPVFMELTRWTLLLSALILFWYHAYKFDLKTVLVYAFIAISSFGVEYLGVSTGKIFGSYTYGSGLGLKINHTPLLIGINWLMLSYAFASIVSKIPINRYLKPIGGAGLMVLYDLALEQVAPFLNLWTWENNTIPFKNYFAWFVLSYLYIVLLLKTRTVNKNPVAFTIVMAQWIFFLVLLIINVINS